MTYFCRFVFVVLLYCQIVKYRLKFNNLKRLNTQKNNSLNVQILYNLQNHPTCHQEERLVSLVRRRECFVGLSLLLVYGRSGSNSKLYQYFILVTNSGLPRKWKRKNYGYVNIMAQKPKNKSMVRHIVSQDYCITVHNNSRMITNFLKNFLSHS